MSLDDLEHEATWTSNHASFDNEADPEKPALQLLTEHLDNGFCELFLGPLQAERYLDRPVVPSPLACVSKVCRTCSYRKQPKATRARFHQLHETMF